MAENNRFFPEIKGNFGFGCMRLPMKDGNVDFGEFSKMADAFLESGLNYFDTAHGYIGGRSETAIRECVVRRYDRSRFLLTNKLTAPYFNSREEIRPFFESQLKACGVDYFDFYLMHAQGRGNYPKFQACKAYETAFELKKEGLVRHVGLSFHDKAEFLDRILTDHPEVEAVQIQFNYVDYEDESVESRKCYEVCEKHGKPMIVMEPVKGGSLVNLPPDADAILRELNGGSNASYALRFAASHEKIAMVLSGMSNMAQMEDNLATMVDFRPLSVEETAAVARVCAILRRLNTVPCTACKYCVEMNKCPKDIQIPSIFAALNSFEAFRNWNAAFYYGILTNGRGKASDCVKCGKCEAACPQHLGIRQLLERAAETFEKRK